MALIRPNFDNNRHTNFLIIFNNDSCYLSNPLSFIERDIFMYILKFPFLTLFALQNAWKLYISSTPWQSTIHILVDTTLIWDLLRHTKNKFSDGDHVRTYHLRRCWILWYSQWYQGNYIQNKIEENLKCKESENFLRI